MKKNLNMIISVFVSVALVFVIGVFAYKNIELKPETVSATQASVVEIKAFDWSTGGSASKVTVVEYLDFECEACGAYYPTVERLKKEYGDSVTFVVRYFPLPGHRNSRTAAYAAEAAGKQGKFWEMYNILFTKQREWSEQKVANQSQFEKYAQEAGVDIVQWKKDVASAEVKKRVNDSYEEAKNLQLTQTPSFFVNGAKIQNPRGYDAFKKLIDAELAK